MNFNYIGRCGGAGAPGIIQVTQFILS
jgi:hypothetical protein